MGHILVHSNTALCDTWCRRMLICPRLQFSSSYLLLLFNLQLVRYKPYPTSQPINWHTILGIMHRLPLHILQPKIRIHHILRTLMEKTAKAHALNRQDLMSLAADHAPLPKNINGCQSSPISLRFTRACLIYHQLIMSWCTCQLNVSFLLYVSLDHSCIYRILVSPPPQPPDWRLLTDECSFPHPSFNANGLIWIIPKR